MAKKVRLSAPNLIWTAELCRFLRSKPSSTNQCSNQMTKREKTLSLQKPTRKLQKTNESDSTKNNTSCSLTPKRSKKALNWAKKSFSHSKPKMILDASPPRLPNK